MRDLKARESFLSVRTPSRPTRGKGRPSAARRRLEQRPLQPKRSCTRHRSGGMLALWDRTRAPKLTPWTRLRACWAAPRGESATCSAPASSLGSTWTETSASSGESTSGAPTPYATGAGTRGAMDTMLVDTLYPIAGRAELPGVDETREDCRRRPRSCSGSTPLSLQDLKRELWRVERRLEITETPETTLHEDLERERLRAERARPDQERDLSTQDAHLEGPDRIVTSNSCRLTQAAARGHRRVDGRRLCVSSS